MTRPMLLIAGWLAATAAAVAVAWAGVSVVAGRVVDPLPATAGLQPDPQPGTPVPTLPVTSPAESTPPTSTPAAGPASEPSPRATADASPVAPPPTQAMQAEERTYDLVGGTVVLRFEPGRVTVLYASANQGFRQEPIEGSGTAEADVEFRSETHRSKVQGWWEDGPRDRVEEDPRDSGGGDDDDDEPDDTDGD